MKHRNTETKGQRVKTFKAFIPQSDLTTVETQVVVYFKADTGLFAIFDGAHMFDPVRDSSSKEYDGRSLHMFTDRITSDTLDRIVDGFGYICKRYEALMRDAAKRKVIRFTFKANRSYREETDAHKRPNRSDISFCGSPAIHFEYEVLYRVGNQVYWRDERDGKSGGSLQYRGEATEGRGRDGAATTIDWTEEREAFFANMKASLVTLIHRVEDFQTNLEQNVDLAIASAGVLLLPKPEGG